MKRLGIHKPTIEEMLEISGVEALHPGGFLLTRRAGELAKLQPGMTLLDVSSGRGTNAVYYAREFGVTVTGIDIDEDMVRTSKKAARDQGLEHQVEFLRGDSQQLPFADNSFDAVINECAVGIPDDSQQVLNEMVRVTKPGGAVVIHESTWRKPLTGEAKAEFAERYGTTPLEYAEWMSMLETAGVREIITEFDQWSRPEMFWNIRTNRKVPRYSRILTLPEKLALFRKLFQRYSFSGLLKALENEQKFFERVLDGTLGYCLFKGTA